MKKLFSIQLRELVAAAFESINESAIKRGRITFYKGIPEGDEDEFFDLPTISHLDKHYNYTQYGVLSVERIGEDTILHTKGKTEGEEGLKDFKLSELDSDNREAICDIADLIKRTRRK